MRTPKAKSSGRKSTKPRLPSKPTRQAAVETAISLLEKGSKSVPGNDLARSVIKSGIKNSRVVTDVITSDMMKQYAYAKGAELAIQYAQDPAVQNACKHIVEKLRFNIGDQGSNGETPRGESSYMEASPTVRTDAMTGGLGFIYHRRLHFGTSWTDKRMVRNENLYKKARYTFIDTNNPDSCKYQKGDGIFNGMQLNTLYSSAGINRIGVWNPLAYLNPGWEFNDFAPTSDLVSPGVNARSVTKQNPYIERGILPTLQQRYEFIHQHLMSKKAFRTFLNDPDRYLYDLNGQFDLEFAIKSTKTRIQLYNRNPDYRTIFKVYVVRYKQSTNLSPQDLLTNWQTNLSTQDSPNINFIPDKYAFYPPGANVNNPTNFPNLQYTPVTATTGYTEYALVPGATGPGFSPAFNAHLEVVDVFPVILEPNDKHNFEVTIEYPKPHSLRELMSLWTLNMGNTPEKYTYSGAPHYTTDDLALLITHCGEEGSILYTAPPPLSADPIVWNATHTPSRMGMQYSNEYEWFTRDEFNPQGDNTTDYDADQIVQSTRRELNFTVDNLTQFEFNDPNNVPVAGSNLTYDKRYTKG